MTVQLVLGGYYFEKLLFYDEIIGNVVKKNYSNIEKVFIIYERTNILEQCTKLDATE